MNTMRYRVKGFTLVELLVVISIIALLLSILMPTLQKARGSAQRVICAARLKETYMSGILYVEGNKGKIFPRENWFGPNIYPWWNALSLYAYATPYWEGKAKSTLVCPAHIAKHIREAESKGKILGPTYAWNYGPWEKSRNPANYKQLMSNFYNLKNASRTMLFTEGAWDNRTYFYDVVDYYDGVSNPAAGGRHLPEAIHNGSANINYADGHVDPFKDTLKLINADYGIRGGRNVWGYRPIN